MAIKPQNTLFLSLSGIGNFLMHLPTIQEFKRLYPAAKLTVWVAPRGTSHLARHQPAIDAVFSAPISRSLLLQFSVIRNLRRKNFDTALMLSPGQRWKGALHLLLAGIPLRIGHGYPHLGNESSPFLLTKSLPENPAFHDNEQNLNLLTLLAPEFHLQPKNYSFAIPAAHQALATKTFSQYRFPPNKICVGLHAGSASNFLWKRWPADRFTSLAKSLVQDYSAHILLFGGKEEFGLLKAIWRQIGKKHASIVQTDLLTAAGLMQKCRLFISNDSGLMHLSAAVGTPTLGLFGPTDETKTGPRGTRSFSLRPPGTTPVYQTETNFDLGRSSHPTLLALDESIVRQFIQQNSFLS